MDDSQISSTKVDSGVIESKGDSKAAGTSQESAIPSEQEQSQQQSPPERSSEATTPSTASIRSGEPAINKQITPGDQQQQKQQSSELVLINPSATATSSTDPLAIAAAAAQASFPDLYAKGESLPAEPPSSSSDTPAPTPAGPQQQQKQTAPPTSTATTIPQTTTTTTPQHFSQTTTPSSTAHPPPAASSLPVNPATTPTTTTDNSQSLSNATTTTTTNSQQQQQQLDDDAAIEQARLPLTKLYGPYVSKISDTNLADARQRLKTALQQTYGLRTAFTERVYDKYRIRLHPPEPIQQVMADIRQNPKSKLVKLRDQAELLREEKEIEKKEATKLNAELARTLQTDRTTHVLANVDNAEQLMYLTAGLNLVILPEEPASSEDAKQYKARHSTKTLSQAAATAGEIILDRARKASAMRVERQRQRQLRLLRGESADDVETNYAAGLFAASPRDKLIDNSSIKKTIANFRRPSSSTIKVGRSKAASTLSVGSALLNISPTADEDNDGGPSRAATLALIAKGVGSPAEKSMQHRLKHPHPESLGGMRRANQQLPAGSPHSHVANALPPLPVAKERLERRKVQTIPPRDTKARQSVHAVLKQFMTDDSGGTLDVVSKIDLLNAVRKLDPGTKVASQLTVPEQVGTSVPAKALPLPDHPVYPFLTVSVFYSLGLLTRAGPGRKSQIPSKIPHVNPRNKALNSTRFKKLRDRLLLAKPTLSERMCSSLSSPPTSVQPVIVAPVQLSVPATAFPVPPMPQTQASRPGESTAAASATPPSQQENATTVPAKNIRGGGEIMSDQTADAEGKRKTEGTAEVVAGSLESAEVGAPNPSKKRRRPSSSPAPANSATTSTAPMQDTSTRPHGQREISGMQPQPPADRYYPRPSASADLSSYFGGLSAQQGMYDLPTMLSGPAQGQLQSLGFARPPGMMGYTIQERAAAAILTQDQRLLGGYGHAGYGHVGHHALPAYLGPAAMPPTVPASHSTPLQSAEANYLKRPNPAVDKREEPESKRAKQEEAAATTPNQKQQQCALPSTQNDKQPAAAKAEEKPSFGEAKPKGRTDPLPLSDVAKEKIKAGAFYHALEHIQPNQQQLALDYLSATGSTIPIPNNLVLGPLKERLNTPGFKGLVSREIVSAAILTWLWHFHQTTFKEAFEKNGRIDVDPNCKWFIQAAVSTSMGELSLDIAESVARGAGAFAEAKQAATAATGVADRQASTVALHISTAATVSRSLNVKMRIDEGINSVLSRYEEYVDLLDEARMGALRARTRERAFLMALMNRNTMVTEPFSNAYTSAMIRASEALGHDGLVDMCQEDNIGHSTLLPYDVLADDNGAWEDPCKPSNGFTECLTGDELMRKAHARASVQKSLRGLQEKFHIRGGTSGTGAYADPLDPHEPQAAERIGLSPRQLGTRDSRRRATSTTESPIPPGTGSVAAWSWSVYSPNHISNPLEWSATDPNNGPYGSHGRSRALSIAAGKLSDKADKPLKVSTTEMDWVDIASTFQSVEIPRRRQRANSSNNHDTLPVSGPIVAPFVQRVDDVVSIEGGTEEGSEEEDLSEEHFLANHKIVLDEMKTRLDAFFESRKKHQENRRGRSNK